MANLQHSQISGIYFKPNSTKENPTMLGPSRLVFASLCGTLRLSVLTLTPVVLFIALSASSALGQGLGQGPPTVDVNVVNSTSNPVPVTGIVTGTVEVANQQEPVRLRGACGPVNGACGLVGFTVPTGKRLVIEYVSTWISGQTASGFGVISIQVERTNPPAPPTVLNSYPFANAAFFNGISTSSQLVRIYANAGEVVNISGSVGPFGGANVSFNIEVTGYLIPVS